LHTVITAVGALTTVGALVSGCDANVGIDGTPAVGKDALQTDIGARLAKAGEQPQSVTCKEALVGEVGKTTRCEVVMSATNSFEPVITVTGVDGSAINYEMSPAVSKEQLEKAVSRLVIDAARVQVASVSCESGLEGKVGATSHCDVDAGGVKLRRTVEVNSIEGSDDELRRGAVVDQGGGREFAARRIPEAARATARLGAVRRQPRGQGGKHRRLHGRLR
jgi:hypothetical protein